MILSNPPYIKTEAVANLQPEIVAFEPIIALDGGSDGLDSITQIVQAAHQYLKPGGTLLLEIAHDQKEEAHRIMTQCGHYDNFGCRKDYSGYDRVVEMMGLALILHSVVLALDSRWRVRRLIQPDRPARCHPVCTMSIQCDDR